MILLSCLVFREIKSKAKAVFVEDYRIPGSEGTLTNKERDFDRSNKFVDLKLKRANDSHILILP